MFKAYFFVPLSSFLLAWILTCLVRVLAHRFGLYDSQSWRKIHSGIKPRLGGAAFFLSSVLVFYFSLWVYVPENLKGFPLLLLSGLFAYGLGVFDDLKGLGSKEKMVAQVLLGTFFSINFVMGYQLEVFGVNVSLGAWSIPLTVFWLALSMNAINIIDGLDGLSSCLSLVSLLALLLISISGSSFTETIFLLALVGGLSGFLMHNFPPASIFMGDGGSYFLGLTIGATVLSLSLKAANQFDVLAGAFLVGLPLLETLVSIVRRKAVGRSIFLADNSHIHHRLIRNGFSTRRILLLLTSCQVVFCGTGLMLYYKIMGGVVAGVCLSFFLAAYLYLGEILGIKKSAEKNLRVR